MLRQPQYHYDCVMDWMKHHDECPNCRQHLWDPQAYNLVAAQKLPPELQPTAEGGLPATRGPMENAAAPSTVEPVRILEPMHHHRNNRCVCAFYCSVSCLFIVGVTLGVLFYYLNSVGTS